MTKTRAERPVGLTAIEHRGRRMAPLLVLAALVVACGAGSGDVREPGEPIDGEAADASSPSATAPGDGETDAAGDGDAAATSMPALAVDRSAEPAPAAQPPIGDIVELRGILAVWPQPAGSRVRAAVELDIADGFHVNANPPAEDWIIPTEVRLEDTPGVELASIHYPPPESVTFDFWAEPLDVWQGSPVVGLVLALGEDVEPGERTARIVVRYQACNDDACFRPMEATLPLALEVSVAGAETRPVDSPLLRRAPFPER